jgi:hypothetical protein
MRESIPDSVRSQRDIEQAVLFIDLLGFAALTERFELDRASIQRSERLFSLDPDEISRVHGNALTSTFRGFHQTVKFALDLANMRHPLTAITFSDSAFIATDHLNEVANIAIDIVQSLATQRIPVRMGIAYGSFAAVRFRSDVTSEGGEHSAHFLGTGVVRAHATESCGIKGIRLLLHPSALGLIDNPIHNTTGLMQHKLRIVECSAAESGNAEGVGHEIDYWRFRPTAEAEAWHALQDMWSAAPIPAANHYQATAEAINRMRIGQGAPALTNLRRRTLPRWSGAVG